MSSALYLACDIAKEKGLPLASRLTTEDFKWTLASGSATETVTYYIHLKDGGLLFVQLAHSNIGLSPTIQTSARYVSGDIHKFETANHSSRSFKLSADRLSVNLDGMSIQHGKGNEMTVELSLKNIHVNFTFTPVDSGYKIGEGKTFFNKVNSNNFICHKFLPGGRVTGKIILNGKESELAGDGIFIHALLGLKPHEAASKCNLISLQSENAALSMLQFETPRSYGSKDVTQGAFVYNNELVAVTVDNTSSFVATKLDPDTKYEVPTEIKYIWSGETLKKEKFVAEMTVKPQFLLAKIDVLSELPFLLRKVIQTLFTKPYVYQYYDNAEVQVVIGEEKINFNGKAFYECSFLN
ncbi:oxidative stress survival, Svf1-like protein [Basidiobolus meristosporus CBS 931.73]|uniref:Oxidative stress survival, Svf1-like protein n=1 Tax=Basidiobolus meristosporus CBS 931.73 TaxID=1314790 RepID=A0A1Y1XXA9_9FUNG|nr:oxidative stress survival, Svf1-like protein [Basidiobolus meristosporus CBS 931.73]|eukprot:ORX90380.1 oxidative stress survival, Svf1-like protein [Basidiobolus meristosporus CBS 931.73]